MILETMKLGWIILSNEIIALTYKRHSSQNIRIENRDMNLNECVWFFEEIKQTKTKEIERGTFIADCWLCTQFAGETFCCHFVECKLMIKMNRISIIMPGRIQSPFENREKLSNMKMSYIVVGLVSSKNVCKIM